MFGYTADLHECKQLAIIACGQRKSSANIKGEFGKPRSPEFLAWPPLQSPAVKKKLFSVQILGREKCLKFGEKCR